MFESYLAERYQRIEKSLEELYPKKQSPASFQRVANEPLSEGSQRDLDLFFDPGYDLLRRGGKRIRPLVLVLLAEVYESNPSLIDEVYRLSPFVEVVHNGTLITDDIEDSSPLRRGEMAVHLKYGLDISLNGGNLMYFQPTLLLEESSLPDSVKLTLFLRYHHALRRLHLGQGFDIVWHGRDSATQTPSVEMYEQMCRFKTGSLFRLAAEMGVSLVGREDLIEPMGDIWEMCGLVFQIYDDVVNLTKGNVGKQRGDDIIEGKKSLPVIYHLEKESPQPLLELFKSARKAPSVDEATPFVEEAIALLEKSGSIERTREYGRQLLFSQREKLEVLLPSSEGARAILSLLEKFSRF